MQQYAPALLAASTPAQRSILPMMSAEDLTAWERLDDVIMVSQQC